MARTHRSYQLLLDTYLRAGINTSTIARKMIKRLREVVTPELQCRLDMLSLPRKAREFDDRMAVVGSAEDDGSGIKYSLCIKYGIIGPRQIDSQPVSDLGELHEWLTRWVTIHDQGLTELLAAREARKDELRKRRNELRRRRKRQTARYQTAR